MFNKLDDKNWQLVSSGNWKMRMLRWTYKLLAMMIGLERLRKIALVRKTHKFLHPRLAANNDIVVADTPVGKMYLDIGYIESAGWNLFLKGSYEEYETELFKRVVSQGMTVVDLGAHIGYYTLLAAKLVGDKGKVFAFEPTPNNFDLLVKNIEVNGYKNIVAQQKAVSNKNGTTKLFLCQRGSGSHSLYNSHDSIDSVIVDVMTLDAFWRSEGCPPIDVIKMDIEGAEMAALEGMTQIISRSHNLKIMTEFEPNRLQRLGLSPAGFLNKLIEYGFKLYAITSKEPWIIPVDVPQVIEMSEGIGNFNLFCQKSP